MSKVIVKKQSSELAEFQENLVNKIAEDMVNISARIKDGDSVMIFYDVGGRQLAKQIATLCAKKHARVWYRVREMDMESILVKNLTERDLLRLYGFVDNEIFQADAVFMVRAVNKTDIMSSVPGERMKLYNRSQKPVFMDYRVKHTNWQLIYWPTIAESEIEGITFENYVELFFDACNQPWDEIEKANSKLVNILNKGKKLTLIADPNNPDQRKRTKITMSIEGMSFLNLTINRNYPGSEVFSSPVINSVNGQLFASGERMLGHEGKIVKDVFFEIKDGKIVRAEAASGAKDMNDMLDRDEGARFFGEVAFGTNPGLRRQVFNGLLNEKVGGSFHITPGKAYENEVEEDGSVTVIDNGNRSEIHWDLTIMMLPEYGGGEVIVDGETIQKDGKFLVPGTEVLNKGLE